MINQEILTKAIEKAIAGGWHNYGHKSFAIAVDPLRVEYGSSNLHLFGLLYDHDFAKALWNTPQFAIGEVHFETSDGKSEWEYHLQQMVIADDPIKYLGENI